MTFTLIMQDENLCFWVGQRVCKFSHLRDSINPLDFKREYCDYCLRGQQVVTLSNLLSKVDSLIISKRK